MKPSDSTSPPLGSGAFPVTHWTIVLDAGKDSSPDARAAFGKLYGAYHPALLAYLRRRGKSEEQARDLVNSFFEFLLEKKGLGKVHRKGKFRSWLLTCLKHFLSDAWDKDRAAKRGGGQVDLPIGLSEDEVAIDPPHPGRTPEEEFDRQYALSFLETVMGRLEADYQSRDRLSLFENLQPFLLDKKQSLSHAQLGQRLGMSEASVSAEVSRLRKRYRDIFDEELINLIGDRQELPAEKQFLFAALSK